MEGRGSRGSRRRCKEIVPTCPLPLGLMSSVFPFMCGVGSVALGKKRDFSPILFPPNPIEFFPSIPLAILLFFFLSSLFFFFLPQVPRRRITRHDYVRAPLFCRMTLPITSRVKIATERLLLIPIYSSPKLNKRS